jgi:ubiquinone/menaquinone biosynthesis C-methylase UbiE
VDHADHVALLRPGVLVDGKPREGTQADPIGFWLDLGAGSGAFTLALADLLAPDARILAIDRDRGALAELDRACASRGRPGPHVETRVADFTKNLGLTDVDGVVMANSLHFFRDKRPVLARVRSMLKPDGRLLVVEYDADRGNPWVPYPFTFETWRRIATEATFAEPRLLERRKSRFLNGFWSASTTPITAP